MEPLERAGKKPAAVKSRAKEPEQLLDSEEEEVPQWSGKPEDFEEFTARARVFVRTKQAAAVPMEQSDEETPTLDNAQVI